MILGIMACENVYLPEEDSDVRSFSYDEYLEQSGGYQVDPSIYNNTTETKIKSKDDIIELAKNEVLEEYNSVDVWYDKSNSIWRIIFGIYFPNSEYVVFDGSQHIFIDNNGITKLIRYPSGSPFYEDSDVLKSNNEGYADYLEGKGGKLVDANKFKNTAEAEIKTKDEVIELAKNELIRDEYDKITVRYDTLNSTWSVSFWLYDKPYKGQYVFINSKGVTELMIYGG